MLSLVGLLSITKLSACVGWRKHEDGRTLGFIDSFVLPVFFVIHVDGSTKNGYSTKIYMDSRLPRGAFLSTEKAAGLSIGPYLGSHQMQKGEIFVCGAQISSCILR